MNTGVRLYERNGPTKKDKHTVEDNIFIKYKVFSCLQACIIINFCVQKQNVYKA